MCVTNLIAQHHHNLIHDVEHGNAGTNHLPDNIKSEHREIISSNSAKANLLLLHCFVLTQPSIHEYELITNKQQVHYIMIPHNTCQHLAASSWEVHPGPLVQQLRTYFVSAAWIKRLFQVVALWPLQKLRDNLQCSLSVFGPLIQSDYCLFCVL